MVACTTLASACIWSGLVKPLEIPSDLYYKKILPIAACYAGALWTSNEAYAVCSVSFAQVGPDEPPRGSGAGSLTSLSLHPPTLQMIKSGMPVAVFLTGTLLGTERFRWVMPRPSLLPVSFQPSFVACSCMGPIAPAWLLVSAQGEDISSPSVSATDQLPRSPPPSVPPSSLGYR